MARKTKTPVEVISGQSAFYAPTCPACGVAVTSQATVEAMDTPPGWAFFGRKGERWIRCHAFLGTREFIHFITLLNDRRDHRLAWLDPDPADEQEQYKLF